MIKNEMNPKVDWYFTKEKKWKAEIEQLRMIALDCGLSEDLKWGCPCYTYEKTNIVLIHVFKEYCAFLFFKGALMKDPKKILIQQTPNVQSARQIRFTNVDQIVRLKKVLKTYIFEAVKVEESGAKVEKKRTEDFAVPLELQNKLKKTPKLKKAFEALTPGRQRAYLFFFGSAKQSKTREARIDKYVGKILEGKGLDDE